MRKVALAVIVLILLAAGHVLSRGLRGGVSLISRDGHTKVECHYLSWNGLYRRDIDLTGKVVNPNTNSYCPFLDDEK